MAEFGVSEWLVALAIFLVGAAAMWHADRVQEKGFASKDPRLVRTIRKMLDTPPKPKRKAAGKRTDARPSPLPGNGQITNLSVSPLAAASACLRAANTHSSGSGVPAGRGETESAEMGDA